MIPGRAGTGIFRGASNVAGDGDETGVGNMDTGDKLTHQKERENMPVGVIVNVLSVVIGGFLGTLMGDRLSDDFKKVMSSAFGTCAMAMGISSIVLMQNMPAVVFSVIAGTIIGCAVGIDRLFRKGTGAALARFSIDGIDNDLMLTAIVLFCFSSSGIYGSLLSGMDGDHSILIAKSILDFFTAMIFACQLKKAVCLIGVPQLAVMMLLFFTARLIIPLTTPTMINDFKASGGIVLLATGLNLLKVTNIPVANMIPAMILAMPVSAFWTSVVLPLLK